MVRFLGVAERWNKTAPPKVTVCAAGQAVVIFPNQVDGYHSQGEIAYRYIQNTGAGRAYYSFGAEGVDSTPEVPIGRCNDVDFYHGYIEAGQALECGHHRQMVTVYSTAGTTIAAVIIYRNSSQPNS